MTSLPARRRKTALCAHAGGGSGMRRSSSMTAESTGKAICRATAAMRASSPVWRRLLPRDAVWLTSHLVRTHQTAQAIFAAGDFDATPEFVQDKDLAEQHLGDWQGLDRRTFLMNRSQEPGLVLVCDSRRTCAERRKLRRSGGAGRRRDRARQPSTSRRRYCRRGARRHHPRRHRHRARPAAARRLRLHDRQLLADPA